MKEYFLIIENKKIGPLSFDQLSNYDLSTETLVWFKGLKDWEKLRNIEELSELVDGPPPIIIDKKLKRSIRNKIRIRSLGKSFVYSLIFSLIIFAISLFAHNYFYYLNPNYEDVIWGDSNNWVRYGDHKNLVASDFYGNISIMYPTDYNGMPIQFNSEDEKNKFCTNEFIKILKTRIIDYKNHILNVSMVFSFIGFGVLFFLIFIFSVRKAQKE